MILNITDENWAEVIEDTLTNTPERNGHSR